MTGSPSTGAADVPPGKSFFWRAQSPDGLGRSATWMVKAAKNSSDFYVGPNSMAGKMKYSFHESGQFQASLNTAELAAEWLGPGASRHLARWDRPPEFTVGSTHLLEAILQFVEGGVEGKSVAVLPCDDDFAVHVYVMTADISDEVASVTFSPAIHLATLRTTGPLVGVVVAILQDWDVSAHRS